VFIAARRMGLLGSGPEIALLQDRDILDLSDAVERLRRGFAHLRRRRSPADLADSLPEFTRLPRYQGTEGRNRLYDDFVHAMSLLPVTERNWIRLVLGFDDPNDTVGQRRDRLGESNGAARMYRDRYTIQSVLHRLQLAALDAAPTTVPFDTGLHERHAEISVIARVRYPTRVRHVIRAEFEASRASQRLLAISYSASHGLTCSGSRVLDSAIDLVYIGVQMMDELSLPVHLFWLSHAPTLGQRLSIEIQFEHVTGRWIHVTSSFTPLASATTVRVAATPRASFARAQAERRTVGAEPTSEVVQRRKSMLSIDLPRLEPYEVFTATFFASDKNLLNQRRYVA
jgi:hypothetical protein